MAEIVNLRTARKAKLRSAASAEATANRAAFGRTKAEKEATAAQARRQTRTLDGAKLEN
ncbi:MAG: DUF4169 family protein [Sphingomonas sp.]